MWNRRYVLVLALLVSCGGPNPAASKPYAAYGCREHPNTNSQQPRPIHGLELGVPVELQGGAYRLFFSTVRPTQVRVRLEGIESYDSLFVLVGDLNDVRRAGSLFHDGKADPALTQALVESKEALASPVSVTLDRHLDDDTLRNDEGKRLFCQRYRVVAEAMGEP